MSDDLTFRGRRPSVEGAPKRHVNYLGCDVQPPPAYRELVDQWIRAHAARVALEMAAMRARTHSVPKAVLGGTVDSAEERKRRRKGLRVTKGNV